MTHRAFPPPAPPKIGGEFVPVESIAVGVGILIYNKVKEDSEDDSADETESTTQPKPDGPKSKKGKPLPDPTDPQKKGGKKSTDSGKNEPHGNPTEKPSIDKQIEDLQNQKKGLPKKGQKKIDDKIRRIRQTQQKNQKGATDHRRGQ